MFLLSRCCCCCLLFVEDELALYSEEGLRMNPRGGRRDLRGLSQGKNRTSLQMASCTKYTVKKASDIPVPGRDVTYQTLPGRELFNLRCTYIPRVPQNLSPRPNWHPPLPPLPLSSVYPPEPKGGGGGCETLA